MPINSLDIDHLTHTQVMMPFVGSSLDSFLKYEVFNQIIAGEIYFPTKISLQPDGTRDQKPAQGRHVQRCMVQLGLR